MPGSMEKTIPPSRVRSLPSTRYGSSWTSRPIPCPVRWVKRAPNPQSPVAAARARPAPGGRPPDDEGAVQVRAVPAPTAAGVDDDDVPLLDDPLPRLVV